MGTGVRLWGDSWGSAWGDSWGTDDAAEPAQTSAGGGGWFWAWWQVRRAGVAKGAKLKVVLLIAPAVATGGTLITRAEINPGRATGQIVAAELLTILAEFA